MRSVFTRSIRQLRTCQDYGITPVDHKVARTDNVIGYGNEAIDRRVLRGRLVARRVVRRRGEADKSEGYGRWVVRWVSTLT